MNNLKPYRSLCSLFYDTVKKYPTEKELTFYLNFLKKNPGRVLEAMCGSGRLLIPFTQHGNTTDGVDNSSAMLNRCKQRCSELNLQPLLFEATLDSFISPHSYTTVTIAVASFQLITDREAALQSLQNLHKHMVRGGTLLIDIFVPDTSSTERFNRSEKINNNTLIQLSTRYIFDEEKKIADAFCTYELIVDGIVQQQEHEILQITWYNDQELINLLNQAGFQVINFYDETFRSAGPSRIVHAQK